MPQKKTGRTHDRNPAGKRNTKEENKGILKMMNTENAKTGCLICGEDIIYLEKAELMKCAVC